jgi:Na+/melibiose symporter-like transporter
MGQTGEHRAGRTFLLGFGFLGVAVIWSLYNAYVPIFLKENFRLSSTLIGLVMTIDNVLAILLLPYLGSLSDRTRTRLGRRRPYIRVGSVLALVFFLLVPAAGAAERLALMMLVIVAMNLSMALFRSPVIALMPDITPSRFRSQANGIINFMGGLGALLVYFGGKPLYDTSLSLPFVVGGIVMLVACLLVVLFIREPPVAGCLLVVLLIREPPVAREEGERFSLAASWRALLGNLQDVFSGEKSLLAILLAILCWFVGFNAIETFFTSYAKYHLGMKESTGALILGFFSVTFMAGSLGAGFLAVRLGRRRTIRAGLLVVCATMLLALVLRSFLPLAVVFAVGGLAIFSVLLVVAFFVPVTLVIAMALGLGGLGWALVNVNSLPMVVDMTTLQKVGGYTGLYYFFSQAANIIAPPAAGVLIDAFGYASLMAFASLLFVAAFFILSRVRRGEASRRE